MKFQLGFDANKDKEFAPIKVPHSDAETPGLLLKHLTSIFNRLPTYQPIVIICVGTDRSTGDSLGPLVGTHLDKIGTAGYHLFGTLHEPVHAMNLSDTLISINKQLHDPFIVAIDACLGQASSVGSIQIAHGPLRPGAGVNKELPPVGNIHVTGIVNVGGFMEYFVLQNTRLSLVMRMSEVIADCLHASLRQKLSLSTSAATATAASRFD
jgi:putative sporulation protein YyaC